MCSHGGIGPLFGCSAKNRSEGKVVYRLEFRGAHLIRGVSGEPQNCAGPDYDPSVRCSEVFLSDVEGDLKHGRVICAIVDDERNACRPAETGDCAGGVDYLPAPEILVPELQDLGATLQERFGSFDPGDAEAIEGGRVENRVNAG